MHQLAIALSKKGYEVSGSDDEIFEPSKTNLQVAGILPPLTGWFPEKISADINAVILGMHAREDNEELKRAKQLGLNVYSFPEYIYQESREKTRIVVGGSHGKTTTTSMIMHVLKQAGMKFDYLVGARLEGFDQSVYISDAPVIICEGDEYPASVIERRPKFHFLYPHIAIITGIAWDHINVFPSFEIYLEQFRIFIDKIQPGGKLIYNESDHTLHGMVNKHVSALRKVGYTVPFYSIEHGKTKVTLDGITGTLNVFGSHNLLNVHAAYLVCQELGIGTEVFLKAITGFTGAANRLELIASNQNLNVYRDFAHAPSKVKATIEAVKEQFPGRRLVALLELHTYSSLNADFMVQYQGSMEKADTAAVFYSGHALELKRMPELAEDKVYTGFAKQGLSVINNRQKLEDWLHSQDYKNASLLLMSSGNYDALDIITFANDLVNQEHKY